MDTQPILTPDIFLDERCDTSDYFEYAGGDDFSLRFDWDGGPVQDARLSRDTIKTWHPNLLEVFDTLLHRDMMVKTELIKITLSSHWLYENHRVDPDVPADAKNRIHNWLLHKIVGVNWLTGNMEKLEVTLNLYRTAKTKEGLEYASENMRTSLWRPLSWLEQHYPGGEAILGLAQSLGADSTETAKMLQAVYIPHVMKPLSNVVLPDNLET